MREGYEELELAVYQMRPPCREAPLAIVRLYVSWKVRHCISHHRRLRARRRMEVDQRGEPAI